jgi:hypothetical protein
VDGFGDGGLEFEDFEGAGLPVVAPADDEVAPGGVVAVGLEVRRAELELDGDGAPGAVLEAADGAAVGEGSADVLDDEAGIGAEGAEDVDDGGWHW